MRRLGFVLLLWGAGVACQVAPSRSGGELVAVAPPLTSADLPRLCVLDSGPGNSHEARVRETLLELLRQKGISRALVEPRLTSLPIYESDGRLPKRRFLEQIARAGESCDLVHLSWNLPHAEGTIEIEGALESLGREKAVLVAAAGGPPTGLQRPLADSVLGRVASALIVGERGVDGLIYPSYTGPEMLTALPAPAGTQGSSFSSLILTAEIIARWQTRTSEGWRAWARERRDAMASEYQRGNAGAHLFRNAPELVGK